jgi:hypothetical protein
MLLVVFSSEKRVMVLLCSIADDVSIMIFLEEECLAHARNLNFILKLVRDTNNYKIYIYPLVP